MNLPALPKHTYTKLINEDMREGTYSNFYDWPERLFVQHPPPHSIRDVLGKFGQEIREGVHPYNNPALARSKDIQNPGVRQALRAIFEKYVPQNDDKLTPEQNADIIIKRARMRQWMQQHNHPPWLQGRSFPVEQARMSMALKTDTFPNAPRDPTQAASYHGLLQKEAARKTPTGTILHTGASHDIHRNELKRGTEYFVRPNVQVTEEQPGMLAERWPHKRQRTAKGQFPKRSDFPQKH